MLFCNDILPIQIIDSRRLSAEENIWLKDLDNKLDVPELQRITAEIARQGKAARIKAYLDVITRANSESLKEMIRMSKNALTLDEIFEEAGLVAKWEARGEAKGIAVGEAKGEERKAFSIAQNLVKMGLPVEVVVSATELDPEKVKALYNK